MAPPSSSLSSNDGQLNLKPVIFIWFLFFCSPPKFFDLIWSYLTLEQSRWCVKIAKKKDLLVSAEIKCRWPKAMRGQDTPFRGISFDNKRKDTTPDFLFHWNWIGRSNGERQRNQWTVFVTFCCVSCRANRRSFNVLQPSFLFAERDTSGWMQVCSLLASTPILWCQRRRRRANPTCTTRRKKDK